MFRKDWNQYCVKNLDNHCETFLIYFISISLACSLSLVRERMLVSEKRRKGQRSISLLFSIVFQVDNNIHPFVKILENKKQKFMKRNEKKNHSWQGVKPFIANEPTFQTKMMTMMMILSQIFLKLTEHVALYTRPK